MLKVYDIRNVMLGTIYKKENFKRSIDMTVDLDHVVGNIDNIKEQLSAFNNATNLRIAVGDYVIVVENISQEYWKDDLICLWYAISSCMCKYGTRAFLIDKETLEVKGARWTNFVNGYEDTLKKYNCIVSFEDNRTVYWRAGDVTVNQ